jgi:uncharacterized protein
LALFPINRRKFLRVAATAGVTALGADSLIIEPNRPQIIRRDISLRRWPIALDGFTIALLSDFHYDPYFSVHPIRAAVKMVNALEPDLIALTGDFVSVPDFGDPEKGAAASEPCAELLRPMKAPYGVWAIMGNHDAFTDPERVTQSLVGTGLRVLSNQSIPIEHNGGRFWLAGIDDVLGGSADLDATLRQIPAGEATVLLAHEPDYADRVARYPVDLQLSGHTHGGQIRLPFLRPLYLPELARKYLWGLYSIGNLVLYTNRGIGTVELPVRFNCPPEITLITVRRQQ